MMNEARIGVGLGATMLGYAGYDASLDYAKNRPQGRPVGPGGKDAAQAAGAHHRARRRASACCWRRRATAKARWRSSCTARGWSTSSTPATTQAADDARLLLEVLTPIAKSWPSEWCLEANSLAIQVHRRLRLHARLPGRAVLARQPPEHDPRGHARHPGARPARAARCVMDGGARPAAAGRARSTTTIERAPACAALAEHAEALAEALQQRRRGDARGLGDRRSRRRRWPTPTPYLQAFGHLVLAWIWLDVAHLRAPPPTARAMPQRGRLAACRYFFHYELPKIGAWLGVVERRDDTCRDAGRGVRSDGRDATPRIEHADLGADLRRPVRRRRSAWRSSARRASLRLDRHRAPACVIAASACVLIWRPLAHARSHLTPASAPLASIQGDTT